MYNRYVPQPDGTFRRNRIPDPCRPTPPKKPQPQKEPCSPPQKEVCPPPPKPIPVKPESRRQEHKTENPVGGFLKHLLPKDFDTSDLIVVLLLLLLAGDCPEEQNTALLTLAIYLFL